jgi:hypothetical protein
MTEDKRAILAEIETLDAEALETYADSALNVFVLVARKFAIRFPAAHMAWKTRVAVEALEAGRSRRSTRLVS